MKNDEMAVTENRTAILWIDPDDLKDMLDLPNKIEALPDYHTKKVGILIILPKGTVVKVEELLHGIEYETLMRMMNNG